MEPGDTLLEELAGERVGPRGGTTVPGQTATYMPPVGQGGRRDLAKVRYTHEAMIDILVSNPSISQNELANHFGYSAAWVSTILCSDAFQAQLAKRRDEVVNPLVKASMEELFKGLVFRSLEVLQHKLAAPVNQISDNVALRAAELGAKALGIGGHKAVQINVPAPDRLERLAERLIQLQSNVRQGVVYEQVDVDQVG